MASPRPVNSFSVGGGVKDRDSVERATKYQIIPFCQWKVTAGGSRFSVGPGPAGSPKSEI